MVIFKFTKRRDYLSAISLLVVLVYVLVINPVLLLIQSGRFSINSAPVALTGTNLTDGSVLNKAFWVVLAFYQLYILLLNRKKIFYANLKFYLPIIALVLLEFLSTLWSAEAEVTLRRSLQQLLLIICIASPFLLKINIKKFNLWLGILFIFVVGSNYLIIPVSGISDFGYSGYFTHKNSLGQVSVIATYFLTFMAVKSREKYSKYFWYLSVTAAIGLCVLSNSKTSMVLLFICPLLAIQILRISGLVEPLSKLIWINAIAIIIFVLLLCLFLDFYSVDDISAILFGDRTFTGRTKIWSFVEPYLKNSIYLGSGYGAFWNLGNSSASIGFGFIEGIIQAHNGYIDVALELGLVGLAILFLHLVKLFFKLLKNNDSTNFAYGVFLVSTFFFILFNNLMESSYVRDISPLWVILLLITGLSAYEKITFKLNISI